MQRNQFPWNFSKSTLATTRLQTTKTPRARSRWIIFAWALAIQVLLCVPGCSAQSADRNSRNISIPLFGGDSSEVVYTPFFCNATTAEANPQSCAGAWQSSLSDGGVISTGQDSASGNILPQMFFRFRASQAYITMDETSTATINVTISARNITIMNTLQASLGTTTVVNLPEDGITTLTITVLPSSNPVPFRLIELIITTPLDAASTSIFPTLTLPAPTPISTWFNPTTTSFATSTITMPANTQPTDRGRMIALAVGLTVGLGLGLTALLVVAFFYWKKRRRISRLWRRSVSRVEFD